MATRDLARTIIEGGQCKQHAKAPRRDAKRSERMNIRAYLRNCARDRGWDEGHVCPERETVGACSADRTAALRRWMEQYVGRSWDEAYAAVVRTHDRRTTKGRHLIEGHFRARDFARQESTPKETYETPSWFAVDADGTVISCPRQSPKRKSEPKITPDIVAWLAGRKIARRGATYFWLVPVERWVSRTVDAGDGTEERTWERVVTGYRQGGRFAASDRTFFAAIDPLTQQALTNATND